MNLDGYYVACICEGSAEHAIMDLLLDADKLIFNSEQLLEEEIIRSRSVKNFEKTYLRKGFNKKIIVVRILDSTSAQFNLSKAYADKVAVIDVVTTPEIEMLIIVNENKYNDFKKSNIKTPSEFCKIKLRYKNVKSYNFVKEYFNDINKLVKSIHEYRRISNHKRKKYTLFDLLK